MDVIFAVIRNTAASAAQCEGGANNGGQANFVQRVKRDLNAGIQIAVRCCYNCRFWIFKTDAIHGFAEQFAIFGHFDGIAFGTNHFDIMFGQNAHFLKRKRGVQSRLPTHCGQQRVWFFLGDDLGHDVRCNWLDVRRVGKPGIRHDSRRV